MCSGIEIRLKGGGFPLKFSIPFNVYSNTQFSQILHIIFSRFFLLQNKMKELELLCSMKEVSFDGNDLENMVLSLRLVMLLTKADLLP